MPRTAGEIIQEYFAKGDAQGAFEAIYVNAQAHGGVVPWDQRAPAPLLVRWADAQHLDGTGKRALVIGCGLGDDAETLAQRGFTVTAFDLSPTAIAMCHERWQHSPVTYTIADVTQLPTEWHAAFDFVFESRTLQVLPWQLVDAAAQAISRCLAPQGELLVLCLAREPHESKSGIPWRLSTTELAAFTRAGLRVLSWDEHLEPLRQFCIHYTKESLL